MKFKSGIIIGLLTFVVNFHNVQAKILYEGLGSIYDQCLNIDNSMQIDPKNYENYDQTFIPNTSSFTTAYDLLRMTNVFGVIVKKDNKSFFQEVKNQSPNIDSFAYLDQLVSKYDLEVVTGGYTSDPSRGVYVNIPAKRVEQLLKKDYCIVLHMEDYHIFEEHSFNDFEADDIGPLYVTAYLNGLEGEFEVYKDKSGIPPRLAEVSLPTLTLDGFVRGFWSKFSPSFTVSKPFTQQLLTHSLQDVPEDLYFGDNSSVEDLIINSNEYKNYLRNLILAAEDRNLNVLFSDEVHKKGINFDSSNDLSTSIAGTKRTKIAGFKNNDGSWHISTFIYDLYDFEFKFDYIKDEQYGSFTAIANDLAYLSQFAGSIQNYWTTVEFDHIIYPQDL